MADDKNPTVDEILALLSKTSLPTVIIEGKDDVVIYRKLEDIFLDKGLSIMPVGGRDKVLQIFEKISEIKLKAKVIFIADKDLWVISGIPQEYQSAILIFTEGYSVENDVFEDCNVEHAMSQDERAAFSDDINRFIPWYSLNVARALNGLQHFDLKQFPDVILDDPVRYAEQTSLRDNESFPEQINQLLESRHSKYLRGKSLMHIAMRQLNKKGRAARLNTSSILGLAPALPGNNLRRIFSAVEASFLEAA